MINNSGIYKITNISNEKIYIGSAKNLKNRWSRHKNELRNNNHSNQYLQNSWNKYGEQSFEFTMLEIVDDINDLEDRENYYLNLMKSYKREVGYNILRKAYSSCGFKHSENTKNIIGNLSRGRKVSKVTREKIRISLKGRKRDEVIRYKISYTKKNSGYKHSLETREKIREANTGKKQSIDAINKRLEKMKDQTGENNYASKLKEKDVWEIKILLKHTKKKQKEISEIYGVSKSLISSINKGKSWPHIDASNIKDIPTEIKNKFEL